MSGKTQFVYSRELPSVFVKTLGPGSLICLTSTNQVLLTFIVDTGPQAISSFARPPAADKEAMSMWSEEPLK